MASDHLLAVHSNRIAERYQRIYFKDIQALIVEQPDHTEKKFIWGGIMAAMAIIFLLLIFTIHYIAAGFFFIVSVIPFSVLLSIADCRCYAVTALGRYRLGALKQNEALHQALAILTPLIVDSQKREVSVGGTGPSEVF